MLHLHRIRKIWWQRYVIRYFRKNSAWVSVYGYADKSQDGSIVAWTEKSSVQFIEKWKPSRSYKMYLVFGTYISFRVSFPTNVTYYKFCMLDKARKRHRRHVRVFLAKKRISPRSLFFAVFFPSLPALHPTVP